jgi:hypothetical protein
MFPFYSSRTNVFVPSNIREWFTDGLLYIIDVIAIPEMYQSIMRLFNWHTRPLHEEEIELAKSIFGDNISYDRVSINSTAKFGIKKIAIAYVSFNTINYDKKIKKEIFIHEMVHIWQYQHFGSIYIARAIKAQRSKEGYDYGGPSNLYTMMLKGARLIDFNFEQQADIIEDYYKLTINPDKAGPIIVSIYQYYAAQLVRN